MEAAAQHDAGAAVKAELKVRRASRSGSASEGARVHAATAAPLCSLTHALRAPQAMLDDALMAAEAARAEEAAARRGTRLEHAAGKVARERLELAKKQAELQNHLEQTEWQKVCAGVMRAAHPRVRTC